MRRNALRNNRHNRFKKPANLHYLRMQAPVVEAVHAILRQVRRLKVVLIVVDSLGLATGANVNESEPCVPIVGSASRRALMAHQIEVLDSWFENGCRGLVKHATGAGKTVTVEVANSHVPVELLGLLEGMDLLVGAIDVASTEVETPDQVAAVIRTALEYAPPERIFPCTNCGMVPLGRELSRAKLAALGAGAEIVRRELAG